MNQQTTLKNACKYMKMKTSEQLDFLEYYMIPQTDQFEYVYRPGDDSFLMLSVLKEESEHFSSNATICEIGSGSGILSAHVSHWLRKAHKQPSVHIATDISLDACLMSQKYYQHYELQVQQICTSILKNTNFQPQIIICNPPYVPTDPQQKIEEQKYLKQKFTNVQNNIIQRSKACNLIAYSYLGGSSGLDTTRQIIKFISWSCKMYLIIMGTEGLETLRRELFQHENLHQSINRAELQLLQFYKKMNEQLFVILLTFSLS